MLLLAFFILVGSTPCGKLPPTRVMFVVDSSSSVKETAFKHQIAVANAVLGDVRAFFEQHDQDPRAFLEVGMIEFSDEYKVRRPLMVDDGTNFEESRRDVCPDVDACGTKYEAPLTAAINLLKAGGEEKSKLIWFLTDGQPLGAGNHALTSVQVEELRERLFPNHNQDVALMSTLLQPDTDISDGRNTLQILSCKTPQDKCTDRVLAASFKSTWFDMEKFKKTAASRFRLVVASVACPVTTTPVVTTQVTTTQVVTTPVTTTPVVTTQVVTTPVVTTPVVTTPVVTTQEPSTLPTSTLPPTTLPSTTEILPEAVVVPWNVVAIAGSAVLATLAIVSLCFCLMKRKKTDAAITVEVVEEVLRSAQNLHRNPSEVRYIGSRVRDRPHEHRRRRRYT